MEGRAVEFNHSGEYFPVTSSVRSAFSRDGCFIIRHFFNQKEIQKIRRSFKYNENAWASHAWTQKDKIKIFMWNQPGNDVTGLIARSEKVVNLFEELMEGEVYHYYTAAAAKGPYAGFKRIPWHQDYYHWYNYGCLFPDMASMYMCLDPINRDNGCLQAWLGSAKCGRLDHVETEDGHLYCDPHRVTVVGKAMPLTYVELLPGDVLVRHCNLLHGSGPNFTALEKMELVITYNKASNDPISDSHHASYSAIQKVPSSAILDYPDSGLEGKDFVDPTSCPPQLRKELYKCSFH